MRDPNKVDCGAVQVHKKVIGDIAAAALKEIPGVKLSGFGLIGLIAESFGYANFPGVMVSVDKDEQISLKLHVVLDYGLSIPVVAHQVQEAVQRAVEDALDVQIREINVNIQAVERRAA